MISDNKIFYLISIDEAFSKVHKQPRMLHKEKEAVIILKMFVERR